MAAAVVTLTRPTDVRNTTFGNKKVKFWDVTTDTGDYAANGFTKTAAQLGLKHVDLVLVGSHATQGTDGASAQGIGIRYESAGTVIRFQLYEAAASGAPMLEKTAEAHVTGNTFRIMVVGH